MPHIEYRLRVSVQSDPGEPDELQDLAEMIADVLAEAICESLQPDPIEPDDPFDSIDRLSGIYSTGDGNWHRLIMRSRSVSG